MLYSDQSQFLHKLQPVLLWLHKLLLASAASWQLPLEDSRNGIIKGFKLFYKKKGFAGSASSVLINGGNTLTKTVTGLLKYTEYEFQVLAFTSAGDGTNSSVKTVRTNEDGKQITITITVLFL